MALPSVRSWSLEIKVSLVVASESVTSSNKSKNWWDFGGVLSSAAKKGLKKGQEELRIPPDRERVKTVQENTSNYNIWAGMFTLIE